ncbi:MAG: circularly permuted type 2 ATP-grasp protein, partial [Lysobacterales bacterium]
MLNSKDKTQEEHNMARANISSPTPYRRSRPTIDWNDYDPGKFYDEIISSPGHARAASRELVSFLRKQTMKHLVSRQQAADLAIQEMGISFTVYDDGENIDRAWPMDIIPRIISLREWGSLERGLVQRLTALNLFIDDIYNQQKILKDGVVPR